MYAFLTVGVTHDDDNACKKANAISMMWQFYGWVTAAVFIGAEDVIVVCVVFVKRGEFIIPGLRGGR